jgi:hypothetical protein
MSQRQSTNVDLLGCDRRWSKILRPELRTGVPSRCACLAWVSTLVQLMILGRLDLHLLASSVSTATSMNL